MAQFKLTALRITTEYPTGYGWNCSRVLTGEAEFAMARYDTVTHGLSEQALAAIAEIVMSDFTPPVKDDELETVGGIVSKSSLPQLPEIETPAPKVNDPNSDDVVF